MSEKLNLTIKYLGLMLAIIGVLLFKELSYPYSLIMWLPISLGYGIWFGGIFNKNA